MTDVGGCIKMQIFNDKNLKIIHLEVTTVKIIHVNLVFIAMDIGHHSEHAFSSKILDL